MRAFRLLLRLTPVALVAVVALAGCGQTGALYLPDEGVETPVEVRSPTTPTATRAPEAAPEPAPEPDDEDEDRDQPQGR